MKLLTYVRNQETQTKTLIYQFDNHRMTLNAFVVMYEIYITAFPDLKGAGSFHIHRKTMKELWALAVLRTREQPNLAQNLVAHRH